MGTERSAGADRKRWHHLWWTLPIATVVAFPPWVLAAFEWGGFGSREVLPAVAGIVVVALVYFGAVTIPTKLTARSGTVGALVGVAAAAIGALVIVVITP